jgi:hypothetical protein
MGDSTARLLDEEAVRRALSDELAPKRVDAVLERARILAGELTPKARRLSDDEIDARVRRSLRRRPR